MYFYFIFVQFFTFVYAEFSCDIYQTCHTNRTIFTIANYELPAWRATLLQSNVSCPCDGKEVLCIRKCCLPDDTFSKDKICRRSNSSAELDVQEFEKVLNFSNTSKTFFIYGGYCKSVIQSVDLTIVPSVKYYCVDYFRDDRKYLMAKCKNIPVEFIETVQSVPRIYTICLGLSIVFLFSTFVIYFSIQNLRNLPGKILLGYVVSLLVTDVFYVVLQLTMVTEGTICVYAARMMQFSFLASFFWLNVMCFDLWRTFSGFRAFNGLSKKKDCKRFVIYCLYAWGCPAIISIITFIIDKIDAIPHNYKPRLAQGNNCWFADEIALFIYFYSFISVLLSMNFILFLYTTLIIINHNKNQVKLLAGNCSRRHVLYNEEQRFYVYLKLFLIMGINWLMEVLSYFYQDGSIIWDIIDVCNMLHGTLIFVIFVCKRRVLILLNKKLYPKKMLIKENLRSNNSYSTSVINSSSSVIRRENSKSSPKMEMTAINSHENE